MLDFSLRWGSCPNISHFIAWLQPMEKGLFLMNAWHWAEVYPVSCSLTLQQFTFFFFLDSWAPVYNLKHWHEAELLGQRRLLFACLVAVHGPDTCIFPVIWGLFLGGVATPVLHNLNWQGSGNAGTWCSTVLPEFYFSLQQLQLHGEISHEREESKRNEKSETQWAIDEWLLVVMLGSLVSIKSWAGAWTQLVWDW